MSGDLLGDLGIYDESKTQHSDERSSVSHWNGGLNQDARTSSFAHAYARHFDELADLNPWAVESIQDDTRLRHRQGDSASTVPTTQAQEDDGWGEFEGVQRRHSSKAQPVSAGTSGLSSQPNINLDPWGGFDSFEAKPQLEKAESVAAVDPSRASNQIEGQRLYFPRPRPVWEPERSMSSPKPVRSQRASPRPPRDENVLFDAEDLTEDEEQQEEEESDDDFGDFESAQTQEPVPQAQVDHKDLVKSQPRLSMSLIDFAEDVNDPICNQPSRIVHEKQSADTREKKGDPFGQIAGESNALGVLAPSTILYDRTGAQPNHVRQVLQAKTLHPPKSEAPAFMPYKQIAPGQDSPSDLKEPHAPVVDQVAIAGAQALDDFVETAPQSKQDANAWGAWEDFEHEDRSKDIMNRAPQGPPLLILPTLLQPDSSNSTRAPTNVPPPALLLPLFPPIFATVKAELLDRLTDSSESPGERETILRHQPTKGFLLEYLTIATVLARIIAGRKLRWKRDTILSQSMRIGPASSARASGMKLTSLDKGENVREEREVSSVLRLWRLQLGKLRTVVAGAAISATIPEITDTLPVRTAQSSEGAMSAPKPCALCALKRNERVQKVDVDVHDSFGEWWVDHWGHRACKLFWHSYEKSLRSR